MVKRSYLIEYFNKIIFFDVLLLIIIFLLKKSYKGLMNVLLIFSSIWLVAGFVLAMVANIRLQVGQNLDQKTRRSKTENKTAIKCNLKHSNLQLTYFIKTWTYTNLMQICQSMYLKTTQWQPMNGGNWFGPLYIEIVKT
jgi:hypothetical protein